MDYSIDKYHYQKNKNKKKKNKNPININEVDINKRFLCNKKSYGEQRSYKYYIGYLGGTS